MRLRLVALLAALAAGCATTPTTPPGPPPRAPLSPEAAAFFARAEAPGPGGALVVNLDALEDLGLAGKGPTLDQLMGLATAALAQLSTGDDAEAAVLARAAVAGSLLREWARWPGARRFAVLVPTDRALRQGPEVLPQEVIGALAVDEGETDNAQLLAGTSALLRAVAQELVSQEAEVRLSLRGQDLCVEGEELEVPVCARPRRGLMLFGTPMALASFEALPPVTSAAASPGEAPLLMSLRADLGAKGRGRVAFTGQDAVRLSLQVEGASPRDIGTLDAVVKRGISEYDAHQALVLERISTGLAEVQRSLAEDPTAPASLKQASTTLTAQKVVDPNGYWAQMRQSLQMASTQDSFTLSVTVPAGAVEDLADQISRSGMAMSMLGVISAIAIPNFTKFQARARGSEARVNLKSAYIAQRTFFAEKERWGRSFEEIGFLPEKDRRYTYCMGRQCLPCDKAGCKVSPPPTPCQGLTSVGQGPRDGFSICAYANLDADDTWDVWVIDQDGEPQQLSDDTE